MASRAAGGTVPIRVTLQGHRWQMARRCDRVLSMGIAVFASGGNRLASASLFAVALNHFAAHVMTARDPSIEALSTEDLT
jgi:hypothetical protein